MAWKRASTGRGSMPPQITSFEPHARPPDSFRKPRQGDLILFSQISSIRNEGRHESTYGFGGPSPKFPTDTTLSDAIASIKDFEEYIASIANGPILSNTFLVGPTLDKQRDFILDMGQYVMAIRDLQKANSAIGESLRSIKYAHDKYNDDFISRTLTKPIASQLSDFNERVRIVNEWISAANKRTDQLEATLPPR
jgi:hypothetical protein